VTGTAGVNCRRIAVTMTVGIGIGIGIGIDTARTGRRLPTRVV
jgi:hypothetical protein